MSNEMPVQPLLTPLRVLLFLILAVLLVAVFLSGVLDVKPGIPVRLRKPFPKLRVQGWFHDTQLSPAELEGKVRVIEAWAYWCGPCLQTAPHVRELYQAYHSQGVVFLSLTNETNEHHRESLEFLKQAQITWPSAYGANAMFLESHPDGMTIPHMWVLDKQGRVAWEGHPLAFKTGLLEFLLKE